MRPGALPALALLVLGCATGQPTRDPPAPAPPDENLVGYAFSVCVGAGGLQGDAVDTAQDFYMESAEEPWRYEKAKTCAEEYIGSRRNALGRNLVIPDCLAFIRGARLAQLLRMREEEFIHCAEPAPTVSGPGEARPPRVD